MAVRRYGFADEFEVEKLSRNFCRILCIYVAFRQCAFACVRLGCCFRRIRDRIPGIDKAEHHCVVFDAIVMLHGFERSLNIRCTQMVVH